MKPIRAIEDIREGDEVLADDPDDTEPASAHKVSQVHRNWTKRLIHVAVDNDRDGTADGEVLATGEHPFWTKSRGWVFAKDLTGEDELLDERGGFHRVVSAKSVPTVCPTFNLSIEGTHTYFVLAGKTAVLVHNQGQIQPSLGGVGTMGTMGTSPVFQRHEVLPSAWLDANGFGPYRSGPFYNNNPAIYLPNRIHYQVNALQTQWGIGANGNYLVSAEEVLAKNAAILGFLSEEAGLTEAQIQQVMSEAYDHANSLPCP